MKEWLVKFIQSEFVDMIWPYLPTVIFYCIVIAGAIFTEIIITKYLHKIEEEYGSKYGMQINGAIIKTTIYTITAFVLLVNLPGISSEAVNVISLIFGVLVAFSSSSIIANAMGGLMILLMKPYKIGDIVSLSEKFGEVAEIRLTHTLIETDKRELITIPNSKIINDVLVNYSKDQHIISSYITLEYTIDRYTAEKLLLKAAKEANLDNPFVLISKLKNHMIEYEVRGVLRNVGEIITIRSDLNKAIIDEFDSAKIQIMSPERLKVGVFQKEISEIPDVKTKMLSKKAVEKEALQQEKIMFGRAEQIKAEVKKEEILKESLNREDDKLKSIKDKYKKKAEKKKEKKTKETLKKEERRLKKLEDF